MTATMQPLSHPLGFYLVSSILHRMDCSRPTDPFRDEKAKIEALHSMDGEYGVRAICKTCGRWTDFRLVPI